MEILLMGRLSTVDLLTLTSLDQLIYKSEIVITFFKKQPTSMRVQLRWASLSISIPCYCYYNLILILRNQLISCKNIGFESFLKLSTLVKCSFAKIAHWKFNKALCSVLIGLYHPLDGVTNLKYKLLCFLTPNKKISKRNAQAFNRDRHWHLVLCLQLILFH